MFHARADYDVIQDPRPAGIPADEPVWLIRGQDISAPATARFWADEHERNGGDPAMAHAARRHADLMEAWQGEHGGKVADAPAGAL
jgi:hypothetical protein